jgi:hypothetical protein
MLKHISDIMGDKILFNMCKFFETVLSFFKTVKQLFFANILI